MFYLEVASSEMRYTLPTILFLLFSWVCTIAQPQVASQTKWTTWKGDHLQISYPPKWYAQLPDSTPGALIGFFSTIDHPNENFRDAIIVVKINKTFSGTTEELGQEVARATSGVRSPQAKLESSKVIKFNSIEAAQVTFVNAAVEGIKSRFVTFNSNNAIYILVSIYDEFKAERFEKLFDEIVKTIRMNRD